MKILRYNFPKQIKFMSVDARYFLAQLLIRTGESPFTKTEQFVYFPNLHRKIGLRFWDLEGVIGLSFWDSERQPVRPRFSRKLTAKFLVCNVVRPRFRRTLTAKFWVCNIVGPRFSPKWTAKCLLETLPIFPIPPQPSPVIGDVYDY